MRSEIGVYDIQDIRDILMEYVIILDQGGGMIWSFLLEEVCISSEILF